MKARLVVGVLRHCDGREARRWARGSCGRIVVVCVFEVWESSVDGMDWRFGNLRLGDLEMEGLFAGSFGR